MIPPNDPRVEIRVLAAVDAAFAEARRRAGPWLTCHPGCDSCCRRPFAITAQDALRLRRGFAQLAPAVQSDIAQRAAAVRHQIAFDFPGEAPALTPHPEWREWFFRRHDGLPCPILDLASGQCRLYEHRPVACRLAGPLIQIGETATDPCPLCFPGVEWEQIKTTKVDVQLDDFKNTSEAPETLIACIL